MLGDTLYYLQGARGFPTDGAGASGEEADGAGAGAGAGASAEEAAAAGVPFRPRREMGTERMVEAARARRAAARAELEKRIEERRAEIRALWAQLAAAAPDAMGSD